MVWRAVKLATGCFHFFHQSSGSPGVLGVPESQTVNCTFADQTDQFILGHDDGEDKDDDNGDEYNEFRTTLILSTPHYNTKVQLIQHYSFK